LLLRLFIIFIFFLILDIIVNNHNSILEKFINGLFTNIQKRGIVPGVVIASPSKKDPDYFYHWIRDGAITMRCIILLYRKNKINFDYLVRLFNNYIAIEQKIQDLPTISGLGEPKVHVNITPFNDSWGRPQNDGPALRSIVLMEYLEILFENKFRNNNLDKHVLQILYDSKYPTKSIIKKDLEYITTNFFLEGFDLWEETRGFHFYTLMVQRKALQEGSKLAKKLNDPQAGDWYEINSNKITNLLKMFYRENRIISSIKSLDNPELLRKDDSSIILAYLHTDTQPDLPLKNTVDDLIKLFRDEYPINKENDYYLIGRYQNDHFFGGNPWVLLSCALANIIKKINLSLDIEFYKGIDKKIINDILDISNFNSGHFSEQINKNTLIMTSASYLTWNFSEMINYLC
jgi:glucoamylase